MYLVGLVVRWNCTGSRKIGIFNIKDCVHYHSSLHEIPVLSNKFIVEVFCVIKCENFQESRILGNYRDIH